MNSMKCTQSRMAFTLRQRNDVAGCHWISRKTRITVASFSSSRGNTPSPGHWGWRALEGRQTSGVGCGATGDRTMLQDAMAEDLLGHGSTEDR